jgi:pimeloyl-ACP methyl ester carboxylesterase
VKRPGLRIRALAVLLAANALAGCGVSSQPAGEDVTVWRPLGAWSGRDALQTDAFIGDTGLLRVAWEARALVPPQAEAGTLLVFVHSAVSGRQLVLAVDQRGPGRSITYISEDPRSFYLVIESTNLEWTVDVAEGIPARRR